MVVPEPEEPISAILQKRKLRRGESGNPAPMLLSVLSQVYIALDHNEQSKKYMSSCEVFMYGMLRAVRFFHWTTCRIRSTCRLLGSWDCRICSTIIAKSVFNWLEIVESWFVLHDYCGVGSQPALDRGGNFRNSSYCADCGTSFMVTIRSVFSRP
jgi:hypothetical protein